MQAARVLAANLHFSARLFSALRVAHARVHFRGPLFLFGPRPALLFEQQDCFLGPFESPRKQRQTGPIFAFHLASNWQSVAQIAMDSDCRSQFAASNGISISLSQAFRRQE